MEKSKKTTDAVIGRERGTSRIAAVAISILAIALSGVAALYLAAPSSDVSSCTATSSQSGGSNSVSGIHLFISSGAAKPSNAPGYTPDKVTLVIGANNSVTWTNDDSAAHTVTSTTAPSCASFDSGNMNSGASYTHTFTVAGTYQYDCRYHGWMTGTIVVKAGA